MFNFPFEVEHIIPLARGGEDAEANWALACRSCNVYKGVQTNCIDEITGEAVHLFHPRHEVWAAHFMVEPETGYIAGTTPTGRACATALRMNSEPQRLARQQWLLLGLFP